MYVSISLAKKRTLTNDLYTHYPLSQTIDYIYQKKNEKKGHATLIAD